MEAVGIEPTSEELRSPVSPCAAGCCISPGGRSAGSLPRGPARFISVAAFGRDGDPARQTTSIPDRRAGPREGRGYLRSQCVVVIGSCVCLHPFYERMALDTLPTTETVPRRTQYAPRFDYYRDSTTKAHVSLRFRAGKSESQAGNKPDHGGWNPAAVNTLLGTRNFETGSFPTNFGDGDGLDAAR